jgi:high-affinity iron transporter
MLREGIEAALIVGIIAGYLKQTGRERALPPVWFGVGLACVLCVALALACMAFLAVGREGLESVFFLIASVQQDVGIGVAVGAALGLLAALAFGVGVYRGGLKINLRRFFRWTGVFIIFVAAGLLTGALRAFHEAGIWNLLQTTAFDFSAILPKDGALGTLLAGIFGYQEAPTVAEVIAYLGFLLPALILFLAHGRPRAAPQLA